jgi:hypothetical protein
MNKILVLTCALLSGCALAGLEGPERQAKAQESLRNLPEEVAQIPAAIGNDPDRASPKSMLICKRSTI